MGGAARAATDAPLGEQDRQFLYWASEGGMADAALSRLAVDKAQNSAIKQFAQRAASAFGQPVAALRALAAANNVSPPRHTDEEDRDRHDNMAALGAAEFDHLYMRAVIADTRRMITLYDQEATTGGNADILAFVAANQPRLRQLDEEARRVDLQLAGTAPLMSPSGLIDTHQPSPAPM